MSRVWVPAPGSAKQSGFWGCECMATTFPLVNADMKRRGLVKSGIDVYQGGYNGTAVSASAGTHALGGVIDVIQGISLAERKVWAAWGVMMFPRTRAWGYPTSAMSPPHGHGVWHGCPHQTASADRQVHQGRTGGDGLAYNRRRNFEAPTRTWQQAIAAHTKPAPKTKTRPQPRAEDNVNVNERSSSKAKKIPKGNIFAAPGKGQATILPIGDTTQHFADAAKVFPPQKKPIKAFTTTVRATLRRDDNKQEPWAAAFRFVAWQGDRWHRYEWSDRTALGSQMSIETTLPAYMHKPGIDLYLEVSPSVDCTAYSTNAQTLLWL